MTEGARPRRHKSIRLSGFDYSSDSTYFITQCTTDRKFVFGDVVENSVELSALGEIAHQEWERTLELRPTVVAHAFVVMPNPVHLLFSFAGNEAQNRPVASHSNATSFHRQPRSVGSLMSGYKGAVSRAIRELVSDPQFEPWQDGFHEHIVRNEKSFETIYAYILDNPRRWAEDRENPANWDRS